MGREIPGHIDVFLKQAKVKAPRVDIADVANVPRLDDIDDFAHDRGIKKGMADHQHETLAGGDIDQLLTFCRARCHRLFDQRVLSRKQAGLSKRKMMLNGCGDDNCIEIHAIKHMIVARHTLNFRIQRFQVLQARFVHIAHRLEIAVGQAPEVPNMVRAPITTTDYTH